MAQSIISPPEYWDQACKALMKADPIMRNIIRKHRDTGIVSRGDPFLTLARSIVGQQISVAAAQSVWNRFHAKAKKITPRKIIAMNPEDLREAGLSMRKVEYIKDLAVHFQEGGLSKARWHHLEDEEIITQLTAIRGIGRWTAEMFLIFNLMRPDVLPLDDIGLLRGISIGYFEGEKVSKAMARELALQWAPWRTVATWYLWRSIDPIPVDY